MSDGMSDKSPLFPTSRRGSGVTPERGPAGVIHDALHNLSHGHLRGNDARRIADDALEALAVLEGRLRNGPGRFCDVCFTSSFEPCPEGAENAIPDVVRPGGFMRCAHCQLYAAYEQAGGRLENTESERDLFEEMAHVAEEKLEMAEGRLAEATEALRDARELLAKFEYLPYAATVARMWRDGKWITDAEMAAEVNQTKFICPTCTWPQGGHHGPGRYKGNAENTHEQGCSMRAVLDGQPAPRLRRGREALRAEPAEDQMS